MEERNFWKIRAMNLRAELKALSEQMPIESVDRRSIARLLERYDWERLDRKAEPPLVEREYVVGKEKLGPCQRMLTTPEEDGRGNTIVAMPVYRKAYLCCCPHCDREYVHYSVMRHPGFEKGTDINFDFYGVARTVFCPFCGKEIAEEDTPEHGRAADGPGGESDGSQDKELFL